jgi:glycerophosphoryl diester phosphodiesterase
VTSPSSEEQAQIEARAAADGGARVTGPMVFGHRGSSAALPEHTLAAYRRAIDEGVDGLECDVRLTRDGHLVCIHDASLERTSTGRGRVSTQTLAELSRYDFSSWHAGGPADPELGILTLDRLLRTALAAGRPLHLLVETKHPSRFGGQVEESLVRLLAEHGLHTAAGARERGVTVTVMSFSPLAIRRIRILAPDLQTVFLFEIGPRSVWDGRAPVGADVLGPGMKGLRNRPELVRRAHDRGSRVYVWTVNQPADVELVLRLGVDGVISDRPADVLAALGRG